MTRLAAGITLVVVVGVAAAGAAACGGKVQAKTPGPPPSLVIPEPPSRLLVPVNMDPPAPPAASDKPVPPATSTRPTSGSRPASSPIPTPSPTPTPTPVADAPVLQSSANLGQLESKAKDSIDKANGYLSRIKRDSLSPNAKDQFDAASRFVKMATDAIAAKNFVYAASYADKAATLAALIK